MKLRLICLNTWRSLALCLISAFMIFGMISCAACEDIYDINYDISDIPNEIDELNEPEEPPIELPVTILPPREHHQYEINSLYREEDEIDGSIMFFASNGDISVHITGRASGSEIGIRMINNIESRLNIRLPLGVYFSRETDSGNANMVLTESVDISLSAGENINIIVSVARMNIGDIAGADDAFSLAILDDDDPLLVLLYIFERYDAEFEVAQAAIWHLRENVGRDKISAALEYYDGTMALTDCQFEEAIKLVETAVSANQ